MPKGIDGQVDLGALAPFVTIPAGPRATLGTRLPCGTVQNDRARLIGTPLRPAQQGAQIVRHILKTARLQPPSGLLVDGFPRRDVGGQQPPGSAGAHDPAQAIEVLARIVDPLRGVGAHEGELGGHKGPLLIMHIGRIRLARASVIFHPPSLPSP